MTTPGSPAAVEITEVALRDGIQNEGRFIPTAIERDLAAKADEGGVFISGSESHHRKNLNRSVERSLAIGG